MVYTKVVAIGDTQAEFRVTRLVDIHNLIQLFGHCKKITDIVTWANQSYFAGTNPLESTLVEWLPWRWNAGIGFSRQTCARPQMDSHRGPSDDSWGRGWRRIPRRMQTSLAPVSAEYRPLRKSVRSRRAFSRNLGKDVSCRIQYRLTMRICWWQTHYSTTWSWRSRKCGPALSHPSVCPPLRKCFRRQPLREKPTPCMHSVLCSLSEAKIYTSKIQWNDTYLIIQRP